MVRSSKYTATNTWHRLEKSFAFYAELWALLVLLSALQYKQYLFKLNQILIASAAESVCKQLRLSSVALSHVCRGIGSCWNAVSQHDRWPCKQLACL